MVPKAFIFIGFLNLRLFCAWLKDIFVITNYDLENFGWNPFFRTAALTARARYSLNLQLMRRTKWVLCQSCRNRRLNWSIMLEEQVASARFLLRSPTRKCSLSSSSVPNCLRTTFKPLHTIYILVNRFIEEKRNLMKAKRTVLQSQAEFGVLNSLGYALDVKISETPKIVMTTFPT